jgi:Ca2+-binding EF-hand superfamily protein
MGGCGGSSRKKKRISVVKQNSVRNSITHKPVLDKWTEPQINLLKTEFRLHSKNNELDLRGFKIIFPKIKTAMVEHVFKLFDRNKAGQVDFTEFCIGLSRCLVSSRDDKLKFIFQMFDLDSDN